MAVAVGPAFLALTWLVWWASAVGWGWLLIGRRSMAVGPEGWIGAFLVTCLSMILVLLMPLGTPIARAIAVLVVATGIGLFVRARVWRCWKLLALAAVLALGLALLASVTPSNYDTGLYHAGSIAYVRDGGSVLGLANLHDRFGFSSSMWPLSAFLGLGLWDGGEFRLVNGLLALLAATDVAMRAARGRFREPATLVLAGGGLLLLGALIQYPGRLVASSSQDWAAALLIVVSTAYLVDYLWQRGSSGQGSCQSVAVTVALVVAGLAGAMRPTGWIFAVVMGAVLVLHTALSEGWCSAFRTVAPGLTGVVVLASATAIRDVLVSGWLFFPIGLFPVDVPWRFPDPTATSQDITGWARTPFQDPQQTLANDAWVAGWVKRLPVDWGVFAFLALVGGLIVWLLFSRAARQAMSSKWLLIASALAPSIGVLVVWLAIAPDPRFAWGPLLLVALIPLSVVSTAVAASRAISGVFLLFAVLIVSVAMGRGSLSDVSTSLTPLPISGTEPQTLDDGTVVWVPVNGDQCWGVFPLCRPWYSDSAIELRGDTWTDGFQPMSRRK